MSNKDFPYLHGFSNDEQDRLRRQAKFCEYTIYKNINFSAVTSLLEIGCGVGANSEILMRRFPKLQLQGIDINEAQLEEAKKYLSKLEFAKNRWSVEKMDAGSMSYEANTFDAAFMCWVLEHVPEPQQVLLEVRRVLRPGGQFIVNEVMNSSFFLDPYCPHIWRYWMAFNDFQYENAGDPFVGAKLGNLLAAVGFSNVKTEVITWHLDNRHPENRKEIIEFWSDLLLSAKDALLNAKRVDQATVDGMIGELAMIKKNPNAVFMYSFMQAKAMKMPY